MNSNFGKKRAYFNCGSESHLVRDCNQEVNFTRAVAGRIKFLKEKR